MSDYHVFKDLRGEVYMVVHGWLYYHYVDIFVPLRPVQDNEQFPDNMIRGEQEFYSGPARLMEPAR